MRKNNIKPKKITRAQAGKTKISNTKKKNTKGTKTAQLGSGVKPWGMKGGLRGHLLPNGTIRVESSAGLTGVYDAKTLKHKSGFNHGSIQGLKGKRSS
jgi:hypothetical protein